MLGLLALVMSVLVMSQSSGDDVSAGAAPTATPTPSDLKKVAITAGVAHTCALTGSGGVECWGGNNKNNYQPEAVVGLESGVVAIATGHHHNCALKTTGGIVCWGSDTVGQLGNGNACGIVCETPVEVTGLGSGVAAIAAGGHHTCAITTSGGLKCWGYNIQGQLGDGTTTIRNTPVDVVGLASGVVSVVAGGHHTCAVTTSGGAKCWGDNQWGQVGDGTEEDRATPTNVTGLGSGVVAVYEGIFHSCALTTGSGLKCWGRNDSGQLGIGNTSNRSTPTDVVGLSSGVAAVGSGGSGEHTCAITAGGGLKCWGRNHWGQVGDGTITNRLAPVNVVGLGTGVAAVSEGAFHTCALQSGQAKCWGQNSYGQLAIVPALGPEECLPMGSCSKTPVDIDKGQPSTPTATPCSGTCPTATSTPLPPKSYTVDSTADADDSAPGNGVCASSAGDCTLRAAVQEVNANPGPDVILPGATYYLTAGRLYISADVSLSGAGANSTVVDGSSLDQVFFIALGAAVEISDLRVRNGLHVRGGGITNQADLTLNAVMIDANVASLGGGGIDNFGTVTINDSTVSGNSAVDWGGGILNTGIVTINNSTISGNSGGAIMNRFGGSMLTINNSVVTGNTNDWTSGGIDNELDSTVTINNSTISENAGGYYGAFANNGIAFINDSAIINNSGDYTGGIDNSGTMTITNSTVSGNSSGGIGNGASGVLSISNSTITGHTSRGLRNTTNAVTLKNTIVANNGDDCLNPVTSAGHNLDSDGSCGLAADGDISNTNPLLGPLADNGGSTFTHALLPGSPAIDAGSSDCPPPATDQRGIARPGDGDGDGTATCDIGAFECPTLACALPTPAPTFTPTITPTPTVTPNLLDTDGDGCTDQRENGSDETLGGRRDYLNPNDYYDVLGPGAAMPTDGIIDLPNDILGVIQHFAPQGQSPYDVQFDRGPSNGPNPWNMTAPDGVIDLPNDILGVILQFGHNCA